jgi:hypothetical protein
MRTPRFDGELVEPRLSPAMPLAMVTPMPEPREGYDPANAIPLVITAADVIRWDARVLRVVRAVDRSKNAAVMAETTSSSLVGSVFSKVSLGISGLVAVGTNLYEYGFGEHKDDGVGSQQFWVSMGVDFGVSVGVGVGSALAVAVVSGLAVLLGGAAIAAPHLVLGAAALGLLASIVLDITETPASWKREANEFADAREEEFVRLETAPAQMVAPKSGMPLR